jgi:polyribonucleotide nucleotidyltransferase
VINTIQQETGADIAVDDDGAVGIVTIGAVDPAKMEEAKARILAIVDPPKADVGATYLGKVVNITKFGAFVNILPGRDGLVHISKLGRGRRVNAVEDVLELGQDIEVVVEEIDEKGKVSLTPSAAWYEQHGGGDAPVGSAPAAPAANRASAGGSNGNGNGSGAVAVSFDDAFDAELAGSLGDLGPGGEAGGNAGGDRGDRPRGDRSDRGGARPREGDRSRRRYR